MGARTGITFQNYRKWDGKEEKVSRRNPSSAKNLERGSLRPLIKTTPRGFEPLRAEPNGFLVHHLNHSVTVSLMTITTVMTITTIEIKPCQAFSIAVLWEIACILFGAVRLKLFFSFANTLAFFGEPHLCHVLRTVPENRESLCCCKFPVDVLENFAHSEWLPFSLLPCCDSYDRQRCRAWRP
jgi:hypothetical protein